MSRASASDRRTRRRHPTAGSASWARPPAQRACRTPCACPPAPGRRTPAPGRWPRGSRHPPQQRRQRLHVQPVDHQTAGRVRDPQAARRRYHRRLHGASSRRPLRPRQLHHAEASASSALGRRLRRPTSPDALRQLAPTDRASSRTPSAAARTRAVVPDRRSSFFSASTAARTARGAPPAVGTLAAIARARTHNPCAAAPPPPRPPG
jgi:hypothetical protein